VLCLGVGTSAMLAQDAAYRLMWLGVRTEAPADVHAQHVRATAGEPGDAVLVVSHTGSTRETVTAARAASTSGATVIAVTSFARPASGPHSEEATQVKPSNDRILTTHTGSLPRPDQLGETMVRRETEELTEAESAGLPAMVSEAVATVVSRQVDAGIDVVSDGEMSKIGYATYVKERLTGFEGEPGGLAVADLDDYPGFAGRVLAGLVTGTPSCTGPVAVGHLALTHLAHPAEHEAFAQAAAQFFNRNRLTVAAPGQRLTTTTAA
jgi:SIS domain/Cobalamin-independent synthase, Catalytic domain